jgi:hypothetical protein
MKRAQNASVTAADRRTEDLTLCRYSYASRVKPNCGLLRRIRAGPPLKKALKPSSLSVMKCSESTGRANNLQASLTYLGERITHALVGRLALPSLDLESGLDDV